MPNDRHRVAILFPAEASARNTIRLEDTRFSATAEALREVGLDVEGAPYCDEAVEEVRQQLERVDAVLVWHNPIEGGRDRSVLNGMLRRVAATGVFVSTHPDLIDRMGTKEVLYMTRDMSWGSDVRLYRAPDAMRTTLPASLKSGPRVLKQIRGHSGQGIWKVELAAPPTSQTMLRVRHAERGNPEEAISLDAFLARCQPYFDAADGGMIDQTFQPRITDGMVRCYCVGDRVAGFGEQLVIALHPGAPGAPSSEAPPPGRRLYYPPTRPDFQGLKTKLEREWIGQLCGHLGIERSQLPLLWDADFFYGPEDAAGQDTWVLCEINVSSVYPFPDDALMPLAAATLAVLQGPGNDSARIAGHLETVEAKAVPLIG